MKINDITSLVEAISPSSKQKTKVLSRDDLRMGIEFEVFIKSSNKLSTEDKIHWMIEVLQDNNIPYSDVVGEHDDMIEVITPVLTFKEGIKTYKDMFALMNRPVDDSGNIITTIPASGMHVSISRKDQSVPINSLKFVTLLASRYIHDIFPEREYVRDVSDTIDDVVDEVLKQWIADNDIPSSEDMMNKIIPLIEYRFKNTMNVKDDFIKYHTVKLSDMTTFDGRIELRFVGGEGYEHREKQITDQVARSAFIMEAAYGNKFHKEYIKELTSKYIIPILTPLAKQHKLGQKGKLSIKDATHVIDKANRALKTKKVNAEMIRLYSELDMVPSKSIRNRLQSEMLDLIIDSIDVLNLGHPVLRIRLYKGKQTLLTDLLSSHKLSDNQKSDIILTSFRPDTDELSKENQKLFSRLIEVDTSKLSSYQLREIDKPPFTHYVDVDLNYFMKMTQYSVSSLLSDDKVERVAETLESLLSNLQNEFDSGNNILLPIEIRAITKAYGLSDEYLSLQRSILGSLYQKYSSDEYTQEINSISDPLEKEKKMKELQVILNNIIEEVGNAN